MGVLAHYDVCRYVTWVVFELTLFLSLTFVCKSKYWVLNQMLVFAKIYLICIFRKTLVYRA